MSSKNGNRSKRRRSFYSFRKEYPNEFEGRGRRKIERRTVVSVLLIILGLLLIVALGYFITGVALELSNKPIPERTVYLEETENIETTIQ